MNKISAVYKITNTITGDFYIGSSKDVKRRWAEHKYLSKWNKYPNKQLYQDMKEYGVDKFELEVIEEVELDRLKEAEQYFIEKLQPIYNNNRAYTGVAWNGNKAEYEKEYNEKYQYQKQYQSKYINQLCLYEGQTITLHALYQRFRRMGITHPTAEAKKYLLGGCYE